MIAVAVNWATAAAPIQPLAQEFSYAAGAAIKRKKNATSLSTAFAAPSHLPGPHLAAPFLPRAPCCSHIEPLAFP